MSPFAGLRVIDVSPNRIGAQISQLFADFGADVIQVEPPQGASIRIQAAYPFWARGKRSVGLDLAVDGDRETLASLAATADIFIETFQPGVLDELGLGFTTLAAANPRLIYTSVTGFGRLGPYTNAPGYEGLVHAKLGVFGAFQRMSPHTAPPFVNVPFASFAASQLALQGTLAALLERSRSGMGQWVETNLAHAFTSLDTWAWFEYLVADRWPEAFTKTPAFDSQGRPASPLTFMLLVCLTKDGHWLQFAQVAPHLFAAHMKSLGLDWMFASDDWKGLPLFGDDADKRMDLWTRMLEAAGQKTLAEWEAIFDTDPNVFAEQYRSGPVALEHPQMIHDGLTVNITDSERGVVRQPSAIVKAAMTPAELGRSAPVLDEHRGEIFDELLARRPDAAAIAAKNDAGLPLAGVTILELATLFAAPHGTTLLTDLGATVIKVEPLAGDRIRNILPFPEMGGMKAMQGKHSIAIDMSTDEGNAIIRELAATADVVVQGYRAGAMTRMGLDYASVRAGNPNVIYVNAPGYGVDGPYGEKPAYAPSIGAASGIPLANVGDSVPERPGLSIDEVRDGARRLSAASASPNAQADGFAALGVATAIMFGLVARERGAGGQELFSSMLNTGSHAMSAHAVSYPGAPLALVPSAELRGTSPLYRVYEAATGFVFLAAPSLKDRARLSAALAGRADIGGSDDVVATSLAAMFKTKSAYDWESELLPLGIGCVEVSTEIEAKLFDPHFGLASGYVTDVDHPVLEQHIRLAPYIRFSRSQTQALPGVLAGQHTDAILQSLGRTADDIAALRANNIVA
jgi:crotonobetainyl-CoA:carnitine CoA-transferase CaiB-like acyl-CoA transferase